MLGQEAVEKILGFKDSVPLEPEEMVKKLTVTFYPHHNHKVNKNIFDFAEKFKEALQKLGVRIISYEESLVPLSLTKKIKILFYTLIGKLPPGIKIGGKIKKGVSVISLGEGITGNLAMDNTMGFAQNSVITILDMPEGIHNDTEFHKHFDTAMNLFAYHMTNIAIVVDGKKWIPYNFNASHPIYSLDDNMEQNILRGVIPKIAAPIKPPKLSEFKILKEKFDPFDNKHKEIVRDFMESGAVLEKTNLYPPGKLLDQLPFRNDFYKWIGKIHLDHRNGMSYGFLARQMPTILSKVYDITEFKRELGKDISNVRGFFSFEDKNYIVFEINNKKLCLEVPRVWVLTQRSGSNKTKINPQTDLIKIGLANGKMLMEVPKGLKITPDYKPSFDTKVILAHAVGNSIIASVLKYFDQNSQFAKRLGEKGLAMAHWHGYINPDAIPAGWHVYGNQNVPVSCSTPQSAIYALLGKLVVFEKSLVANQRYLGDIHIEPHHGTNICFTSLKELGEFLNHKTNVSKLGNHYLNSYNK